MRYEAVIFDLDGTLINSIDDLADSCNEMLIAYDFPTHTVDAYKYFVGNGVGKLVERALPEDKAAFIRAEKAAGRTVIMIGDGVNDSPALSEADAGIAISTGAAIAREIADITIASEDLFELVTLRRLSAALMARIHRNYRVIVSFNFSRIVLGVAGLLPPTTSALLHNTSTLAISLKSMTNLLPAQEPEHQ